MIKHKKYLKKKKSICLKECINKYIKEITTISMFKTVKTIKIISLTSYKTTSYS